MTRKPWPAAPLALLGLFFRSSIPVRAETPKSVLVFYSEVRASVRPMILLLAVLFAGFAMSALATAHQTVLTDPTYLIDTWEIEDGLPENSATAMVQTPDAYLWFGTFNGLVRFDGVKFTVFDAANTPQLPSASIVNLHCDRSGRLWVSTSRGLAVREGGQWRTLGTNDGWPSDYVRTFSERGNGDLLITTFHGQVFEFVGGRLTELPTPPGKSGLGYLGCVDDAGHWWVAQHQFIGSWDGQRWRQTVASTATNAARIGCTTARDGGVWLLMEKDLRKYRQGVEVSRVQLPEVPEAFWSMSEDSRGNVWICTDHGVCQISPDGRMRRWTTTNGLVSSSTRFVFDDREGNLWVGTSGGGLARFKPRRFQSFGVESGLAELVVDSLWPGRDGGLWIGTRGKGLFRLHDGSVTNVPLPRANIRTQAQSVLTDREGRLWLGTNWDLWLFDKGAFRGIHPEQFRFADIRALFEDSHGRIWIGDARSASVLDGENLRVFTAADGLPADGAYCFAEDSHGVIWLSTRNGVFRLENDRFVELLDKGRPLPNVTCFKADADGTLWMGSFDNGLLCQRAGRLARIAGLPVRAVNGILEDGAGFFWLTSNRGVVRVLARDLRLAAEGKVSHLDCQMLDLGDGLPSVECASGQQPPCARDASGRLWFGTVKGVATIDPAEFRLNTNPPPVTLELVVYHTPAPQGARQPAHDSTVQQLNGSTTQNEGEVRLAAPFNGPLRLPAGSRHIDIHYTALSFSAPERVRFQVKLDGQDADWRDAGDRRVASFYDLPSGDYLFRVRAANNDGVWNETGAHLAFTILPFFWETWWFRIVIGFTLLASGAAAAWLAARAKLRRAAERERAEDKFRLTVEASPNGIVLVNGEGRMVLVNAETEKPFGYAREELIGQAVEMFVPERLRGAHPGHRAGFFAAPQARAMGAGRELFARRKDGTEFPVEIGLSPIHSVEGILVLTAIVDITARKQAEETKNNLAAIVDSSDDAILSKTLAGTITSWNAGAEKMYGYSASEMVGQHVSTLAPTDRKEEVREILERIKRGERVDHLETVRVTRDGRRIDVSLTISSIEDEHGMIIGASSIARDITERKQAEEALQQTQSELAHVARVMTTGELAATIAHEVNQPLTAMVANANAARRMLGNGKPDLDEAREAIDDIVKDAHRASEVVGRIRSLLKKGSHRTEPLAINEVIEEVVAIVRNDLAGKRVSLRMEMATDLPEVEADRVEIQQVILNLTMNAVEAMSSVEDRSRNLLIRTARDESRGVLIEVRDSGIGIASENLQRIFDAFYTTRPEGMGMGLSICRTIIESHGGRLWAESNEGRGATFRFTLPAIIGEAS